MFYFIFETSRHYYGELPVLMVLVTVSQDSDGTILILDFKNEGLLIEHKKTSTAIRCIAKSGPGLVVVLLLPLLNVE